MYAKSEIKFCFKQTVLYYRLFKNLDTFSKFYKNSSNIYNLVKQIGCYGDNATRALPLYTNFSWPSTTSELLEYVRRCRDEVNQKGGLKAGYKVYLILTGILSQRQTVLDEPS